MSTLRILLASVALMPNLLALDVTTLDGKTYKNCWVSKVEPDAVCLLFAGGGARVKFANLPEEVRSAYGYDPQKAAAYEKAQAARKQRDDAWWRAARANAEVRQQAAAATATNHAPAATPGDDEGSPQPQPARSPAAYGRSGPGAGYGGYSGQGSPGGAYGGGGGSEYVGVNLAARGTAGYGGYGSGYGSGYGGGYGQGNRGGYGGGGGATYVAVQLAPRAFGGYGGGAYGGGAYGGGAYGGGAYGGGNYIRPSY